MIFGLLICECAGRYSQRSKQKWLQANWKWIVRLWRKVSTAELNRKSTPSQSCISRFLAQIDELLLSELITQAERTSYFDEWELYMKKQKNRSKQRKLQQKVDKRKNKPSSNKGSKIPHYCLDGKSRKGCVSKETNRTEIDLTLYSPDTKQVLAQRTLKDKQGEQSASVDILTNEAASLPSGVITGDAGITCPNVITAAINSGHSYILAIKGNAGEVFDVVTSFPWKRVKNSYKDYTKGHGRSEIREIKAVDINYFTDEFGDECCAFDKYSSIAIVYKVEIRTHHQKGDKFTKETRFFIADQKVSKWQLSQALSHIRKHWQQESYHWIKDVVLKEDDCPHKSSNGSRALGTLRSFVIKMGLGIHSSVKTFIDSFTADPKNELKKM